MIQRTFFDDESDKMARDSDPETSHMAADETPVSYARSVALKAMDNLLLSYADATANEIAAAGLRQMDVNRPLSTETIRKRVHELVRTGKLVLCGKRPCRVTGKMCQTYQLGRK